ncbi:MAG: hypothetical protein ACM3NW_05190, partial [Syntrophomonadaceae bacterium]
ELLVGAVPIGPRPFRYRELSTMPAIAADLSFSHPRDVTWDEISAFVRGLRLANLESLDCRDRYEGAGVPAGSVKTTVRLTFRSSERTLEQDEVNRQMRRLADELGRSFEVRMDG